MNVAFKTLGCKLNYSETSSISRDFENKGYNKVSFKKNADIYVINTCSVTQNADKEFKYLVNRAKKNNPKSKIIAIGCYAQLKPKEIGQIDGVDLVLGADKKFDVLNYIENNESHSCEINNVKSFQTSYSLGDRTRSFLKVQDGCDYKCTYCTIPLARGKSRSGKINEIIDNVKTLVDKGIKEIVLTGVNIGDYGIIHGDLKKESTFIDLLKNIDKVSGLERVRISSIEPNLLSNEIIHFVSESKKFMPHFHVPLQSGSDKILKLMKRRYLKDLYESRVEKIKSLIPDCSIGVDVIVGFPEEDENDFMETYKFLEELDVSYLHVFSYSERDNTEAIKLKNKNSSNIKGSRSKILRDLSEIKKNNFYKNNIGHKRKVLFESENKNGFIHGYSDNYIRVKTLWTSNLVDNINNVILDKIDNDNLVIARNI
ncbi:MAG: tRNA (N(6)-L-threonylcarbamoyladenosine(37)-C(2))-methylthiotransferase MtaB [Bacteroidota bacterium]|nr:tRNA (N(6)-L-threonylcarbamoyladenosine(37)-C(2))-methylthiotransferase MtaB [Bacteroidota bacterium]